MVRPRIDRNRLEIRPLALADVPEPGVFRCEDEPDDLDAFLQDDALNLQTRNVVQTYLGFYDGALVGYISLLADAVVLKSDERRKLVNSGSGHPVFPAIKVAKLAIQKSFCNAYAGCGEALMSFAFITALGAAESIGCRLLTLDARKKSIGFYEKLGFIRNKDKRYDDAENPSMRLDLFAPAIPAWVGITGTVSATLSPFAAEGIGEVIPPIAPHEEAPSSTPDPT